MPPRPRSIGQVLAVLRLEFEDISISKIRFLESEGLLSPERAPSGYRKYSEGDVDRLRYILQMQKEHYLPLKVIREHLDMIDRGMQPPQMEAPRPVAPTEAPPVAAAPAPQPLVGAPAAERSPSVTPGNRQPIRLSRRELLEASGLSEAAMLELERQLLVAPRRGTTYYGRDALTVAIVARRLAGFGMDARHLRSVKQAAEREVGLIEQAIAPYLRRNSSSREVVAEVAQLVTHAHAALMRAALDR